MDANVFIAGRKCFALLICSKIYALTQVRGLELVWNMAVLK